MPGSFLRLGDNGHCEAKLPVKMKEPCKYINKVTLTEKKKGVCEAILKTPDSSYLPLEHHLPQPIFQQIEWLHRPRNLNVEMCP